MLFSEGLVRTEATEARLQSVVHSASRGNVSLYIVDASGLQTRSYESATGNLIRSEALRRRAAEEKGALDPSGPGGVSLRDLERNEALVRSNPQAGLEWLSASTGGFLIRDTNDVSGALRRIDSDLRFYYLLGYTPANPTWDGRFRTIAVKVRRPGVEVRARGGYFAVHSQGPVLAHVAPALAVLESGGHPRAFEVTASVRSSADALDLTRVSVQATVTGKELARLAERERQRGVDVTLLARLRQGSNGQPVNAMSQRCLVDPSKQKGSDADCRLKRDVWLAPGRYALEVVAYEAKSRRASVAVSDVEIPAGVPGPAAATVPTTDVKPTLPGAAPQPPVVSSSRRPVDPALVPILERAGRYVLEYEEAFRNIVAEEVYTQWTGDPGVHDSIRGLQRRVTRSDLVFVRVDEASWASFRDVFEVDGQKVRDRDGRLEKLFRDAPGSAVGRASAILAESARYNIGTALRRINLPTLALLLLQPRNQPRLEFELGSHRRIAGVNGVEVKFEEVVRPTLFRGEGSSNLPVRGRFWIVPGRGTVLRSEVRYRFEPDRAIATVATEYRPEPRLAMWVPVEMKERYDDLPEAFLPLFRQLTEATARYSNFRKFTVTIEDVTATVPPETPEPRPDP